MVAFSPRSETFSSRRDALGKPRASAMPPATRAALGHREVGSERVLKGRANRAIDRTIVRPYRTRASFRIVYPGLRTPVKPSRLPWAFQLGPFRSKQNREPSGSFQPSTQGEHRSLKMQPNRHRPRPEGAGPIRRGRNGCTRDHCCHRRRGRTRGRRSGVGAMASGRPRNDHEYDREYDFPRDWLGSGFPA